MVPEDGEALPGFQPGQFLTFKLYIEGQPALTRRKLDGKVCPLVCPFVTLSVATAGNSMTE